MKQTGFNVFVRALLAAAALGFGPNAPAQSASAANTLPTGPHRPCIIIFKATAWAGVI